MKPAREHATNNAQTYFVTSDTWERRALFNAEPWARLFFKTLVLHRGEAFLLHEFVLMPDHFHLLITPLNALERSVQLVKGGFSFRAKKELGSNAEIWRRGFADDRIRDHEDYNKHVHYIHLNPVKKHLCVSPAEYRYSSAFPGWKLDPVPQGLKPVDYWGTGCGTTEVVPFQNAERPGRKPHEHIMFPLCGTTEVVPFQNAGRPGLKPTYSGDHDARAEARTLQAQSSLTSIGTAESVPFQSNTKDEEQDHATQK